MQTGGTDHIRKAEIANSLARKHRISKPAYEKAVWMELIPALCFFCVGLMALSCDAPVLSAAGSACDRGAQPRAGILAARSVLYGYATLDISAVFGLLLASLWCRGHSPTSQVFARWARYQPATDALLEGRLFTSCNPAELLRLDRVRRLVERYRTDLRNLDRRRRPVTVLPKAN